MKISENNNYLCSNRNYGNTFSSKNEINFIDNINFWSNWKLLLPIFLAILCYLNGLHGDLVHDDMFAIKKNPDVHGKTALLSLFRNDFWGKPMHENTSHKSYRPLTVLTFRLNYQLNGLEPFEFHVVNVVLHVTVTALFVYTCRSILHLTETNSMIAGILFASHPIHTEAVTGLVGRAEVLAASFFLLSFISYSKSISHNPRRTTYFLCSLAFSTAAMLSKETGVTVLGVCLVFDLITTYRLERNDIRKLLKNRSFVTRTLATMFFTLVLLLFRIWMMFGAMPKFTPADNPASFSDSVLTRVLTYGYLWSFNVWLLLAPTSLCYDWQHGSIPLVESVTDPRNLATLVTLSAIICIIAKGIHSLRTKYSGGLNGQQLCMGVALTVLPFLPASNLFFRVGFVLAERVLYIPSLGFSLLLSIGVCQVIDRWRHRRILIVSAVMLTSLMLAGKTWRQNTVWQTRESLFRSGINAVPHNAKVHYNYGNLLKDRREYGRATEHYREALRLDPDYSSAHNNLGTLLEDRYEAEVHFREALRLLPTHQGAHINLGNLLFKRGLRDEGLGHLTRAVELEPRNPEATTSLAWSLMELGLLVEAEKYLKATLEISPDYYEAYVNYGALLSKTGRYEESALVYKRAFELDVSSSVTLVQAAQQYRTLGDVTEAEMLLKRALDIRRDVNTLEQLAVLYYSSGRTRDSLAVYADIERLNDNSTDTIVRHAKIVAAQGDLDRAETMLQRALTSHPNDFDVINTLALVQSNLHKHEQAAELLTRCIEMAAGTERHHLLESLYFHRGNNYKDVKNFSKALQDFNDVIRINPRHANAHGNLGAIFHINGDIEKARYHYQKTLDIDEGNDVVKQNLMKLDRLKRDTGYG